MTTAFLKDVLKQQPENIKAFARGEKLLGNQKITQEYFFIK